MRGFLKRLLPICICILLLSQAALASATLESGSTGDEVIRLQQALNAQGYTLTADGVYGTATRNAVKAFQRAYGFQQRDYVSLGVARAMIEAYYAAGGDLGLLQ